MCIVRVYVCVCVYMCVFLFENRSLVDFQIGNYLEGCNNANISGDSARPGSNFIYTKNFARPGCDFIGGRCDRNSQFSKQKTGFENSFCRGPKI